MIKQVLTLFLFFYVIWAETELEVLSLTPSSFASDETRYQLWGKAAIQVVFNKAVIALGSDFKTDSDELPEELIPFTFNGATIPGKMRWLTTFSARFDPDIDWPSDLEFSVTVNPNLIPYDGSKVPSVTRNYFTQTISCSISSVTSPKTSEATDGAWSSTMPGFLASGEVVQNYNEVPEDGRIELYFSEDILYSNVVDSIQISNGNTKVSFTAKECTNYYGTVKPKCIWVYPKDLEVDTKYTLNIPQGTKYGLYSGNLKEDLNLEFYGLFSFVTPFIEQTLSPEHFIYKIIVRHGIGNLDQQNFLASMKSSISVTPEIEFELSMETKAIIQMKANWQPSTEYSISINSNENIVDSWGLPLLRSSKAFTTNPLSSFSVDAAIGKDAYFESGFSSDWYFLNQNTPIPSERECIPEFYEKHGLSTVTSQNIKEIIAQWKTRGSSDTFNWDDSFEIVNPVFNLTVNSLQMGELLESGAVLKQKFMANNFDCRISKTSSLVQSSDISISLVKGIDNYLWVTNSKTGENIKDAKVTLFKYPRNTDLTSSVVLQEDTSTTDENGVSTFKINSNNYQYGFIALVETNDKIALVEPTEGYSSSYNGNQFITKLITDRKLFKPKDTIYIKGYFRSQSKLDLIIPESVENLALSVNWNPSQYEYSYYEIDTYDNEYGSFDLTVKIPDDVEYGNINLGLVSLGSKNEVTTNYMGYESILISDPRIPTSILKIDSKSSYLKPEKTIDIEIQTETYSGTPIENAQINLVWELTRGFDFNNGRTNPPSGKIEGLNLVSKNFLDTKNTNQPETESGELNFNTGVNTNGKFNYSLDINNLLDIPAEEGDTLKVTITFIDASRAKLTEEISFPVGFSNQKIYIQPSTENPIPGFNFGAFVDVTDLSEESILEQNVELSLHEWDGISSFEIDTETGVVSSSGATKISKFDCTAKSDAAKTSQCSFNLEKIGKYILLATSKDSNGYQINTAYPLGKTEEEWSKNPLNSFSGFSIVPESNNYQIGDHAIFNFYNVFPNSKAFVAVSNTYESSFFVQELSQGNQQISVELKEKECKKGCSIIIVVSAARSEPGTLIDLPVDLPISILFDINAPATIISNNVINIESPELTLDVSIKVEKEIVTPGSNSNAEITVTDSEGLPVSNAEVSFFVVDKPYLDLVDFPLRNLANEYDFEQYLNLESIFQTNEKLSSIQAYETAFQIIRRRLEVDPWMRPQWNLRSNYWGKDELDLTDDEFYALHSYWLTLKGTIYNPPTYFNYGGGGGFSFSDFEIQLAEAPEFDLAGDGNLMSQKGLGGDRQNPSISMSSTVRTDFEVTPHFEAKIKTNSEGKIKIEYKLPDSISTFSLRAYVVKNDKFGSTESTQISRKQFSLEKSQPEIVRYGDVFKAGVILTPADPDFKGKITVSLKASCGVLDIVENEVTKDIQQTRPYEFLFTFIASGYGISDLSYAAYFENNVQDSFISEIKVLGVQESISVATSMSVGITKENIGKTIIWEEGISLPNATPKAGSLVLQAGVGRLPSLILTSYDILNIEVQNGMDVVSGLIPKVMLEKYSVSGIDNIQSLSVSEYERNMKLLDSYTTEVGLQYSNIYTSTWINPMLNAFGLYVDNRINNQIDTEITNNWKSALERSLIKSATNARQYGSVFSDFELLSFAFLALGKSWIPVTSIEIQEDLSLDRLQKNLEKLSLRGKSAYALTYLYENSDYTDEIVKSIIHDLETSIRIQGQTAYIAYSVGSQNSDITASCLGLSVLSIAGDMTKNSLIYEKLANFVAQQQNPSSSRNYFNGLSSNQQVYSIVALSEYDKIKGNTNPNLSLDITSNTLDLLSASFTPVKNEIVSSELPWEVLGNEPKDLQFKVSGTSGESSIVASMEFIPRDIPTENIYRGISVERIIQKVNPVTNEPFGPFVNQIDSGEIVKVTIQITTPDDLQDIKIIDPVTAGLEPIDDNIEDLSTDNPMFWYYDYICWWCYRPTFTKQTTPGSVIWDGSWIRAGTHSVSYYALSVTSGIFKLPPVKAFAVDQPELLGLSYGGKFVVNPRYKSDAQVKESYSSDKLNTDICLPGREIPSRNGEFFEPYIPEPEQPGKEGESCKTTGQACEEDLICVSDVCKTVGESSANSLTTILTFTVVFCVCFLT